MVALVTGGAGFIGSHIVRALLERGDRVRVLDDLSTGSEANLAGLDLELTVGDIRDAEALAQVTQGVERIFHQAAFVSVPASLTDPVRCYEVNLHGSLNVLWAAGEAGVKQVVLASSAAIYGESDRPVDEEATAEPISPYAASKLAMESASRLFWQQYGLPTVCLRYFNVYGPRQRPDSAYAAVIPAFIGALLDDSPLTIHGDGEQRRDFVYVEDVARANLLAAETDAAAGEVFNVGGGESISVLDLAGILHSFEQEAHPLVHGPARKGDIRHSQAVIRRATEALGYRPEVGMEQGLRSTVEWFRQLKAQTPV